MSKAAWAAIIAAIAFPTIALVIVILVQAGVPRPAPPPPHPPGPAAAHEPPGGPSQGFHPEMLINHRKQLGLTDEQVDEIWSIIEPAHRRMVEIQVEIAEREKEMHALLESDDPDEKAVEALVDKVTGLHAERAKLEVLTPLRVRKVLTEEQRAKVMEEWKKKRQEGFPQGAKQGPEKQGPGPGMQGLPKAAPRPPLHGKIPPPPPYLGKAPPPPPLPGEAPPPAGEPAKPKIPEAQK